MLVELALRESEVDSGASTLLAIGFDACQSTSAVIPLCSMHFVTLRTA